MIAMPIRTAVSALSAAALVVGAVVAVSVSAPSRTLALPGASESTVVAVTPTRVLDTRYDVGLTGKFAAAGSRSLQVTGEIQTYAEATGVRSIATVVPEGATGVMMNLTAVVPSGGGFVSVRPGDATGDPSTASLNFGTGDIAGNAVTVNMPTTGGNAGTVDIAYRTPSPADTVDIVIDIVGYTTSTGLIDLVNRVEALETGVPVARVVWVAESGGDFTSVAAAMAATTGPAVIKLAPGTYTETAPVTIKDDVDIEGSGRDVTTLRCACSGTLGPDVEASDGATLFKPANATSTISRLTVRNTGTSTGSAYGIKLFGQQRVHDVRVEVTGATAYGIVAAESAGTTSSLHDLDVDISQSPISFGIYNHDSDTPITDTSITVSRTVDLTGYGVYNVDSDVTLSDLEIEVGGTADINAYGVWSIDSDVIVEDSNIRASANSADERVAAVFTTRTVGSPSTTIRRSVLSGSATAGAEYGVYTTGNVAFARIADSDITGQTASVRGAATLEFSIVHNLLDPSTQRCFNVALDTSPTGYASFTALDGSCDVP